MFVLVGGAGSVRTSGEPVADRCVERVAVDALQYPAHGRLAGRPVGTVWIAQRGPAVEKELVRGISGPLGDCGEGLRSGQDRAGGQGQDVRQGVPPAPHSARVGQAAQPVQQAGQLIGAGRIGTGKLAQPGGDGRC